VLVVANMEGDVAYFTQSRPIPPAVRRDFPIISTLRWLVATVDDPTLPLQARIWLLGMLAGTTPLELTLPGAPPAAGEPPARVTNRQVLDLIMIRRSALERLRSICNTHFLRAQQQLYHAHLE